jgi:hypothetical protein
VLGGVVHKLVVREVEVLPERVLRFSQHEKQKMQYGSRTSHAASISSITASHTGRLLAATGGSLPCPDATASKLGAVRLRVNGTAPHQLAHALAPADEHTPRGKRPRKRPVESGPPCPGASAVFAGSVVRRYTA